VPQFSVEPWLASRRLGRPHVTLKYAGTLDGFAAATDGTSRWITGEDARARVHLDRSRRDAVIVGTGTVLADDPRLTARRPEGGLYDHQPERVVIGRTDVPADAAVFPALRYRGESLAEVLDGLGSRGLVDVLVEGGPHIAASFIADGLVDAVDAYTAPALLGAGISTVAPAPSTATTIAGISRFTLRSVDVAGGDIVSVSTRLG
jgi:diaminohydroxyphosphoribosylaminopyrimidine deaminase/5-amino-6-(5-phosphoribosylamino)uracil reductase